MFSGLYFPIDLLGRPLLIKLKDGILLTVISQHTLKHASIYSGTSFAFLAVDDWEDISSLEYMYF